MLELLCFILLFAIAPACDEACLNTCLTASEFVSLDSMPILLPSSMIFFSSLLVGLEAHLVKLPRIHSFWPSVKEEGLVLGFLTLCAQGTSTSAELPAPSCGLSSLRSTSQPWPSALLRLLSLSTSEEAFGNVAAADSSGCMPARRKDVKVVCVPTPFWSAMRYRSLTNTTIKLR